MEVTTIGEQLLAEWGRDGLLRWPLQAFADVVLPETSQRLLVEFGLPQDWPYTGASPSVSEALPRVDAHHPFYRVIGISAASGSPHPVPRVCLDERHCGRVISISLVDSERQMRAYHEGLSFNRPELWDETFINSSVEHFAAYLVLYAKLSSTAFAQSRKLPDHPSMEERTQYEAVLLPHLFETELAMRRTDPAAMESPDLHWPSCLAEFRDYTMWDLE